MEEPKKILFVCLGNIVRSPLAENLFRKLSIDSGLQNKYIVDSAGTSSWHVGESPDSRMRKVASKHGLQYNGKARQITNSDYYDFDLIIALDHENESNIKFASPSNDFHKKIHLLRIFDPESENQLAVPDPYYGGTEGFETTYKIIERSCHGLLEAIENNLI